VRIALAGLERLEQAQVRVEQAQGLVAQGIEIAVLGVGRGGMDLVEWVRSFQLPRRIHTRVLWGLQRQSWPLLHVDATRI
jgi:hypothetical protein